MIRIAAALLLLLPASGALADDSAGIQRVDDIGRTVTLKHPAARVISLAPHVTELLYAIGAGDTLVAVSAYSDFPRAALSLPQVGDSTRLDLERIVALRPDLVVGWRSGMSPSAVDILERLGVPLFVTEPSRIDDIPRLMTTLGELTGRPAGGERAAHAFRAEIDRLASRYARRPAVSVFVQIAQQPIMTLNGQHLVSDTLRLCGGRNVFGQVGMLVPQVDVEAVLAAQPQVILVSSSAGDAQQWLQPFRTATHRPAIHVVNADLLFRSGPRVVQGASQVCAWLEAARAAGSD